MPLDELGNKWACQGCISGHRTRSCSHYERMMVQVRRCGRPSKNGNKLSQCLMVFLRYTNDAKDQICRPADGQIPQEMQPEVGDAPPQAFQDLQSRVEQEGQRHQLEQISTYDTSIGPHLQGLGNGTHHLQSQDSSTFAVQQIPEQLGQPLPALEANFPGASIDPVVLHRLGHRCNDHQTGCCTSEDASLMSAANLNGLNGNVNSNGNGDTGANASANIDTSHRGCSCPSPKDCRCVGCDTHPFNLADEDFVVNLINNMSTEDVAAFESHIQVADAGGNGSLLQGGAPMIMPPAQQMHAIHLHPNGQNNFDYRIVDSRTTYGGGLGGMAMDPHAMLPGAQHVNGAEPIGSPISSMDEMDDMLNNYNSTYGWNGDAAMMGPANGHAWNMGM